VLGYFRQCGGHGATRDEVEVALGLKHQTGSVRVLELIQAGFCVEGPDKRLTRSGREAYVVRAKEVIR
jgi:hypothetical protein